MIDYFLYKILNEHVAVPVKHLDLVIGCVTVYDRPDTTKHTQTAHRASTQFQIRSEPSAILCP